jgi:hypothetical protein
MYDTVFIYRTFNESELGYIRKVGLHLCLEDKSKGTGQDKMGNPCYHVSNRQMLYAGIFFLNYKSGDFLSPEEGDCVIIDNPTPEQVEICEKKGAFLFDLKGADWLKLSTLRNRSGSKIIKLKEEGRGNFQVKPTLEVVLTDKVKPEVEESAVLDMQKPNKITPE